MAGITLAKYIADWELLSTALRPHLAAMPFLNDNAAELDILLSEAKFLDALQQELRGRLQQTVKQRLELERRGRNLRSRTAAILRGNLGFDNQTLLSFGIPPRRPVRRKATPPAEVKGSEPAAAPE